MPEMIGQAPCADCQSAEGVLEIRQRHLCTDCFIRYVNSKILKRMESYRFKNLSGDQKKRLFLPLSGGVSSLVLLQALDAQLQKQISNRNRTAYDLVVAHVVLSPGGVDDVSTTKWYEKVAERFPSHTFLPCVALHDGLQKDVKLEEDLACLGIRRKPGDTDADYYNHLIAATTSATTRADLQALFLKRSLVAMAKSCDCESILWGHSDSQLAALALADVAKGRGGSVSSTISDGPSTHVISFNYPVRDLFRAEVELYARILLPEPLSPAISANGLNIQKPITSIRNTSIDDLLTTYINSQAVKYPSIMANVVRTASKLQAPTTSLEGDYCILCRAPAELERKNDQQEQPLCYGCKRMQQDFKLRP